MNWLGHAWRLLTLRHDGDDLPTEAVLWLTTASLVTGSLYSAAIGYSQLDFVLFVLRVSWCSLLLMSGNTRLLTYTALIDLGCDGLRGAWLLAGAHHTQLGWIGTLNAFAWVRAALVIGLI